MKKSLPAIALLFLAGCDSGGVVDQTVRTGVRQGAVEACTAWIPQFDIAVAAGLDPERLCGCAVDRLVEAKSAAALGDLSPGSEATRAAVAQCVAEIQKNARKDEPS